MLSLTNTTDGTVISSHRNKNQEVFITIARDGIEMTYDFQAAMQLDILLGTIILAEEENNKILGLD